MSFGLSFSFCLWKIMLERGFKVDFKYYSFWEIVLNYGHMKCESRSTQYNSEVSNMQVILVLIILHWNIYLLYNAECWMGYRKAIEKNPAAQNYNENVANQTNEYCAKLCRENLEPVAKISVTETVVRPRARAAQNKVTLFIWTFSPSAYLIIILIWTFHDQDVSSFPMPTQYRPYSKRASS